MGYHADGVVFWGYDLGDMADRETWESTAPSWLVDDDGRTDREWEEELATRLGWTQVPFPSHLDFDIGPHGARSYRQHPDYRAYDASRDRMRELLVQSGLGVKLERYGHVDGDDAWYVAIDGSEQTATYDCRRLDLGVEPDWRERVDRFIELLDLPKPDGEPGWFVTSNYG